MCYSGVTKFVFMCLHQTFVNYRILPRLPPVHMSALHNYFCLLFCCLSVVAKYVWMGLHVDTCVCSMLTHVSAHYRYVYLLFCCVWMILYADTYVCTLQPLLPTFLVCMDGSAMSKCVCMQTDVSEIYECFYLLFCFVWIRLIYMNVSACKHMWFLNPNTCLQFRLLSVTYFSPVPECVCGIYMHLTVSTWIHVLIYMFCISIMFISIMRLRFPEN